MKKVKHFKIEINYKMKKNIYILLYIYLNIYF